MSAYNLRKPILMGLVALLLNTSTVFDATCGTARAQDSTRAPDGIGERIGQQLDEGINRLSSELREGWASLRQSVDRMGVQARVYSRLRWDKQIATMDIDIDSGDAGVVTLRGRVRSAAAKAKAVELARDTVGVERVVDELAVMEPSVSTYTNDGEPVARD
ncbi:MAG: BON domain-containing protein [Planctomycetaceae bacterium]